MTNEPKRQLGFFSAQFANAARAGVCIAPQLPRMFGWSGASFLALLASNTRAEGSYERVVGKAFASSLFFGSASPLYSIMTSQLAALSSAPISPGYALNRFVGQLGPMLMAEQSKHSSKNKSGGSSYGEILSKLTIVNALTSVIGASRYGEAGMVEQQLFAKHNNSKLPDLLFAKRAGVLGPVLTARGVVFDLSIGGTQTICRSYFPGQEILAWVVSRGVAAAVATPLHAVMVYYIRENGRQLPSIRALPRLTLVQLPSKVAFQLVIGLGWGCFEQLAASMPAVL